MSIDLDEIYEVIDSIGNSNYSFRLNLDDDDLNTFHNLIVYKKVGSSSPNVYVLEFVINDDILDEFIFFQDFGKFAGTIKRYSLEDFNTSISKSSKFSNAKQPNPDDCPCDEDTIEPNDNTNNGGGSVPNSSTDNPPPSDGDCGLVRYVMGCSGSNGDFWHLSSACGPKDYTNTMYVRHCGIDDPDVILYLKNYPDDCQNSCEDEIIDLTALLPPNQENQEGCIKLNNLLTNVEFKNAISHLKTSVQNNETFERGYEISKNSDGVINTNPKVGGFGGVGLDSGGDIIGGMHTHTSSGYPMFSGFDIVTLRAYYLNGLNTNSSLKHTDVFSVVVTNEGTYAITISAYNMLSYIANITDNNTRGSDLDDILQYLYDNDSNGSPEADLLKFFNSITPIPAIKLYQLNFDGTQFEELSLKPNSNTSTTVPCE